MNILSAGKLAFKGASSAGLLPWFGWALLLVAVLAASSTGWLVHRLDKGDQAIAERDDANKAYDALLAKATRREQQRVDDALNYQQAIERMDAIANKLEHDREANRKFFDDQRIGLEALLDARPDLRGLRLGDDVLRHWNQSNAGPAAGSSAGATARPAGKPATAVPGAAAGAQRPAAGAAGQPRRGGQAVRGLPHRQQLAAGGIRRMAGDGMGLVLQGGGSPWPGCVAVPCVLAKVSAGASLTHSDGGQPR